MAVFLLPAPDLWSTRSFLYSIGACGLVWVVIQLFGYLSSNQISLGAVITQIGQRRKLRNQGIKGPSPSFFYGNTPQIQQIVRSAAAEKSAANGGGISSNSEISHDYVSAIFPYFEQWAKEYGEVYTYSTGIRQHLFLGDPEMVIEMSRIITLNLGKPSYITKELAPLLGNGILRSNGQLWARQRKIIAPEFFMSKVKAMVVLVKDASHAILEKWGASVDAHGGEVGQVRVDEDFRAWSADVISRACFGSSYSKGKEIFSKLRTLQMTLSKRGFLFRSPTFRFIKSKAQADIERIEKEVESLIWEVVQRRVEECSQMTDDDDGDHGHQTKDLLQMILDGAIQDGESKESCKHFIVDNCKDIYFAGHETTAVAASWCLMLLALHTDWQDRLREEIYELMNQDDQFSDIDALFKAKVMTMVIQETLRLYTPAGFVTREALDEDLKLGHLLVPKGVCIWALVPHLHRNKDVWGPDANEFKPERFADGVTNACKFPQAYVPFGVGPRLCVGKNFAMLELRIMLCLILSKFRFSLSPKYQHSPVFRMIIEPGHGVYINMSRIPLESAGPRATK